MSSKLKHITPVLKDKMDILKIVEKKFANWQKSIEFQNER